MAYNNDKVLQKTQLPANIEVEELQQGRMAEVMDTDESGKSVADTGDVLMMLNDGVVVNLTREIQFSADSYYVICRVLRSGERFVITAS